MRVYMRGCGPTSLLGVLWLPGRGSFRKLRYVGAEILLKLVQVAKQVPHCSPGDQIWPSCHCCQHTPSQCAQVVPRCVLAAAVLCGPYIAAHLAHCCRPTLKSPR